MGLFKKEKCCICNNKTGLLDKKCKDGKICKDCRGKLSAWFDEYKESTKEDIKTQIEKKEEDIANIGEYNFDKVFGEFGVILIDSEKQVFAAVKDTSSGLFGSQRKVRSIDDITDLSPDIIKFSQVKDFEIEIIETSAEEKRNVDGNMESYDPPHIKYMYIFNLKLILDHPYINSMRIQLNDGAVQIKNIGRRIWTDPGRRLAAHLLGLPGLIKEDQAAAYDNDSLMDIFLRSKYEMPDYSYGFACSLANWDDILKYQYYLVMAREIKNIIETEYT